MRNSRLWSIMRKELIQITRDRRIVIITFIQPIIMLFLLGFAATNDVRNGPSTGVASGDAGDNFEYDYTGDHYRRTLRQYERRGERIDKNEPGKVGDRPGRLQPRPRMKNPRFSTI